MDSFELRLQCFCRSGSKLLILPFDILERIDKQLKIEKKNNIIKQKWKLIYYKEQQYVDLPELEYIYNDIYDIYYYIYNNINNNINININNNINYNYYNYYNFYNFN